MKLLAEIPLFPRELRTTLASCYGIETAEAFYAHALQNPVGMQQALGIKPGQLEPLTTLIENYLPSDYVERCQAPLRSHPRGALFGR